MKKLLFIPAIILIALAACKKEKPLNEAIIGKWGVQTQQQVYYLGTVKKFEYTYFYPADSLVFEFTEGGSIVMYLDGDVYGMSTFTLNGNTLTIENGTTDIDWNDVSVNGNTLTWKESTTEQFDQDMYNLDIIYVANKTN